MSDTLGFSLGGKLAQKRKNYVDRNRPYAGPVPLPPGRSYQRQTPIRMGTGFDYGRDLANYVDSAAPRVQDALTPPTAAPIKMPYPQTGASYGAGLSKKWDSLATQGTAERKPITAYSAGQPVPNAVGFGRAIPAVRDFVSAPDNLGKIEEAPSGSGLARQAWQEVRNLHSALQPPTAKPVNAPYSNTTGADVGAAASRALREWWGTNPVGKSMQALGESGGGQKPRMPFEEPIAAKPASQRPPGYGRPFAEEYSPEEMAARNATPVSAVKRRSPGYGEPFEEEYRTAAEAQEEMRRTGLENLLSRLRGSNARAGQATDADRAARATNVQNIRSGNVTPEAMPDLTSPQRAAVAADSRLMQTTGNSNPARREERITAEPGTADFPEAYYQGQSGEPGMYASNQTLGTRRVGRGISSSGMTTGGSFGSPLMLGQGPGGETPTRQPFAYKPGRGPTITSPGGQSEVKTPEEFQQTWNQMSGNARGGDLRMALADQRERAAADPRIAANIARNEAAQQRQQGGAPIVTDPAQRQAMWDREMQRKELSRSGVPRPLAATLANLQGNPEAQAALVEQLAGEETARIQSANQPFGSRTATGGRGAGGPMGVAGVVGAQAQRGLEERKLGLEERKVAAAEEQSKWERENMGKFVPPEQRVQVQAAGEQARQAWLTEHPGDDKGASDAAWRATGGLYVEPQPAPGEGQGVTSGPGGRPIEAGDTPPALIRELEASGDPKAVALAERLKQTQKDLTGKRRLVRMFDTLGPIGEFLFPSAKKSGERLFGR